MRQLGLDLQREPPALDPRQRRGAGRRCDRAKREIIPRTYPGNCAISSRSGEFRKKITAVFADLVGSTGLAERLDAEEFRELVLGFLERMAPVVEAHGGMVEHLAGDGVLGVFGAERAESDDALRAVKAASAMLSELDGLNDRSSRGSATACGCGSASTPGRSSSAGRSPGARSASATR